HSMAWALIATYGIALLTFVLFVLPVTLRMLREQHPGLMMVYLIIATVCMALVFHGQHRYRFPIDGFCAIIGAGGAVGLWDLLHQKSREDLRAAVRDFFRRNRIGLIVAGVAAIALAIAWRADDNRLETWREGVCEDRMRAIVQAIVAYRKDHGALPSSLGQLVPKYLYNVEALHCPKHVLSYNDHKRLPSHRPDLYPQIISYALVPPAAPGGEARIAEMAPHHGSERNAMDLSGNLSHLPAAPAASAAPAEDNDLN
ncbi:MAG TPA: hypothetical protein VKU00_21370, partial [Chthonomonadaceae bacterium]|nr:hypothetical protein [Chthonomonadaceae bacterium]